MQHPPSPERSADSLTTSLVDAELFGPTAPFTFSSKGKPMTVNFESLAQAEKSQAVADHERYQELLRDLAAGKDRDETEVLEICRRVDRNVAMLEDDVKWRTRRDNLIAEVRLKPQYESEQQEADTELAKLRAEFEKIEKEFEAKRWPLRCKYNRADERLQQIWMYCNELERDCRDQNIFDELEALSEQRSALNTYHFEKKAEQIQQKITFSQQELDELPAFTPGRKEKKQELKARIKDLKMQYEKTQTEIAQMERKDAELKAREAELRESMIFA